MAAAIACFSPPIDAQTGSAPSAQSPKTPRIDVRLSLSEAASVLLIPRQFRRYLSIELDDAGDVSPDNEGPLGEHVAYVWIDLPDAGRVRIQTRVGQRPVATRTFSLHEGLRADVAARLVAIATSEMVRAQARPLRVRKPKRPKPPTPEQVELATRGNPAVLLAGKAVGAWIPAADAVLGGTGLELSFRMAHVRQRLELSWLGGAAESGSMQWRELGLGVDHTWWSSVAWRFDLGASAHASLIRMGDVASVDGISGERETWSTRATGRIQVQRLMAAPAWLGLALEPGIILRPAPYTGEDGHSGKVKGLFLGLNLSLQLEQRLGAAPLSMVSTSRPRKTTARNAR